MMSAVSRISSLLIPPSDIPESSFISGSFQEVETPARFGRGVFKFWSFSPSRFASDLVKFVIWESFSTDGTSLGADLDQYLLNLLDSDVVFVLFIRSGSDRMDSKTGSSTVAVGSSSVSVSRYTSTLDEEI